MAITTRAGKGSELSFAELDENFTDLRDGVNLMVPKTQGTGIKVDSLGTPDFGWHDINGTPIFDSNDVNGPTMANYRGTIKQVQFSEGNQLSINFHLPHDYLMGSDLFIHVHWSHNSATLTGGSVTWGFEVTHSKGHGQEAFSAPKTVSIVGNATNTAQYHHFVTETALSINGGSGTQLDSSQLEVDGVIIARLYLDSNDLTDSVSPPNPFVHFVDIHYQSTGVPTKQKAPDFWT